MALSLVLLACAAGLWPRATALNGQGFEWATDLFSPGLPQSLTSLAYDPARPTVLLAGSDLAPFLWELDTAVTGNGAGWMPVQGFLGGETVSAIAAVGTDLFVAGYFSYGGNIMRRDAAGSWHVLSDATLNSGDGLNHGVNALAACPDAHGIPSLYVGGQFTLGASGNGALNGIARWDLVSSTWDYLDGGVDSEVFAIACGPDDGSVFVGGNFATVGNSGTNSPNLAYFDGTTWSSMQDSSNSLLDGEVQALAWVPHLNTLFVGGGFGAAGSINMPRVAAFTPTQPPATSIATQSYVEGTWTPLMDSSGGPGLRYGSVDSIAVNGSDIYFGGGFEETDSNADFMGYLTKISWPNGQFEPLMDSNGNVGVSDFVNAVMILNTGELAAGGAFSQYNGDNDYPGGVVTWNAVSQTYNYPGIFTGATGGGVTDPLKSVYVVAEHAASHTVFLGGNNINQVGTVSVNNVWSFDLVTRIHAPLGNGVSGRVRALLVDDSTDTLYVGGLGSFGSPCENIVTWDIAGGTFACLADSSGNAAWVQGEVFNFALKSSKLYISGSVRFATVETVGLTYAYGIVVWDLTAKRFNMLVDSLRGNGVGGTVRALAWTPSNKLLAVGDFASSAVVPSFSLLSWDGTQYDAVTDANGDIPILPDSLVSCMYLSSSGKVLLGGGVLRGSAASGRAVNYMVWDRAANTFTPGYASGGYTGFWRPIFTIIDDGTGGVLLGAASFFVGDPQEMTNSIIRANSAGVLDSPSSVGTQQRYTVEELLASTAFGSYAGIFAGTSSRLYDGTTNTNTITSFVAYNSAGELEVPSFLDATTRMVDGSVRAMTVWNSKLVIAGGFSSAGGLYSVQFLATHSGVSGDPWRAVTDSVSGLGLASDSANIGVETIYVDGTKIFVAGRGIYAAGGNLVSHVASYDSATQQWTALDGAQNEGLSFQDPAGQGVRAITKYNSEYYFGSNGGILRAGDLIWYDNPQSLVKWNPATKVWSKVGLGLTKHNGASDVRSLLVLNSKLYIAGNFDFAPTVSTNNVADYDASGPQWHGYGTSGTTRHLHVDGYNGVDGRVNDVAIDAANDRAIFVGAFNFAASSVLAQNVAEYSYTNYWQTFPNGGGQGVGFEARTISMINQSVLVGGTFGYDQSNTRPLNGLGLYTPETGVFNGVSNPCLDTTIGISGMLDAGVNDIALLSNGAAFLVGERFSRTGSTPASSLGQLSDVASAIDFANNYVCPSASPSTSPTPSTSVLASASSSASASANAVGAASATPSASASSLSAGAASATPSASASAAFAASGGGGNLAANSDSGNGLDGGAVAGIVIAVLAVACCCIVWFVLVWRRKRQQQQSEAKVNEGPMKPASDSAQTFSIGNPMTVVQPTAVVVSADTTPAAVVAVAEGAVSAAPKQRAAFKQLQVELH